MSSQDIIKSLNVGDLWRSVAVKLGFPRSLMDQLERCKAGGGQPVITFFKNLTSQRVKVSQLIEACRCVKMPEDRIHQL